MKTHRGIFKEDYKEILNQTQADFFGLVDTLRKRNTVLNGLDHLIEGTEQGNHKLDSEAMRCLGFIICEGYRTIKYKSDQIGKVHCYTKKVLY